MNRYGFIYKTTNLINNKIYIGQKVYKKNNDIQSPVPSYLGSGIKLKSAIKKYGKKNFKREILCWCLNQKSLDDFEKFFIKYYNSMDENIGYNLCEGGQTDIPKEMLHRFGKENPNYGHKWTKEMKERLSNIAKSRNIKGDRNPNFGNKWTDEQKKRASELRISSRMYAGANNPRAIKIKCLETGKIFDTIKDIKYETSLAESTIYSKISKGKKIDGKTYVKLNSNSPS